LNSTSWHSDLCIHIILDTLYIIFIPGRFLFWWFLCRQLLLSSQAALSPNGSGPFSLKPVLAVSCWMISSCGALCEFAIVGAL
jgi:hypothetical protein